jgi:hypothetical protein
MAWRVALLVVAVVALSLAGGAVYLRQVDRYPLRAVPRPDPRRNAAESCSQQLDFSGSTFVWSAPDGSSLETRSQCIDYVLAHHQAQPDVERPAIIRLNAHNRREREIEWLVFAAASAVILSAASASLFWRRRPA